MPFHLSSESPEDYFLPREAPNEPPHPGFETLLPNKKGSCPRTGTTSAGSMKNRRSTVILDRSMVLECRLNGKIDSEIEPLIVAIGALTKERR